jgi:hypothetical protein
VIKALFAAILVFFVGLFGGHANTPPTQPAAVTQAASVALANDAATPAPSAPNPTTPKTPATTTIIKQYITNPVVEKIVEKQVPVGQVLGASVGGPSLADLQNQINQLNTSLYSSTSTYAAGGVFNEIAASQRINNLASSANSPLTISGATITGSTVNGVDVSNLTSSQWTTNGSDISYTGGNVGIGTTSPSVKLDVAGTVNITDTSEYGGLNILGGTSNTGVGISMTNDDNKAWSLNVAGSAATDPQANAFFIYKNFGTGNSEPFVIDPAGNVGIGTSTPADALSVYRNSADIGLMAINNAYTGVTQQAEFDITSNDTTGSVYASGSGYTQVPGWASGMQLENSLTNGHIDLSANGSNGYLRFETGGAGLSNERMRITSTGNVGIGTTTPASKLDIYKSSGEDPWSESMDLATAFTVPHQNYIAFSTPIYSGSGGWSRTTSPWEIGLTIDGGDTSVPSDRFYIGRSGVSDHDFVVNRDGNVGIGTPSAPTSKLMVWGNDTSGSTANLAAVDSNGISEFTVFNNGNATLAGTLTQNSDTRLKTNVQPLDASSSLAAIDALEPVSFNWIDQSHGSSTQIGFIAQQVQQVFPALVATTSPTPFTPGGTLGLNYIGLIAPIVEAVQQLSAELQSLTTTVQGFAQSFTSKQVTATQRLCVDKSDGSPVCLTGDQLAGILSGTPSVQISAPTPPTISGTTTPPSINIQGSNPANISVGDTYTDLGAIVTDNQRHDLSYRTFINGVLSGNILIDTSQAATDTIDYVATDTWGNTSTSTRTVIIEAATASTSTTP